MDTTGQRAIDILRQLIDTSGEDHNMGDGYKRQVASRLMWEAEGLLGRGKESHDPIDPLKLELLARHLFDNSVPLCRSPHSHRNGNRHVLRNVMNDNPPIRADAQNNIKAFARLNAISKGLGLPDVVLRRFEPSLNADTIVLASWCPLSDWWSLLYDEYRMWMRLPENEFYATRRWKGVPFHSVHLFSGRQKGIEYG